MTQEQIAQRALRMSKRMEKVYAPRIKQALSKQVLSFIADYKRYGLTYARSQEMNTTPLERVLKDLFRTVIIYQANMTYDQLRRAVTKARASMGINEIWNQEVKDFLDNFLLERSVKPISDYSRKLLLEALKKAIDQGFTVEEIVAQVAGIMDDLNTKRAFMIVRTELTTAFNVGHMLGAYDSEYEYVKKWVEVKDNRTRYTHRHGTNVDPKTRRVVTGVGGEVVDFAQPFSNGLMYPGDRGDKTRTVPAAEVINCRCVVTFRLKRDANGNPIPKKKPTTYQYGPQGIMRPSLIQALFNGFAAGTIANMINEFINRGE